VQLPAGLTWRAVRPVLGVRAFGVSGFSAREPGETAGTLVLVRDPDLHRAAVALERDDRAGVWRSAIRFGFALLAAAQDRNDEALAALRGAIERDPRLRAEIEREPLLAPLADRLPAAGSP
jgi:hypothetical protein